VASPKKPRSGARTVAYFVEPGKQAQLNWGLHFYFTESVFETCIAPEHLRCWAQTHMSNPDVAPVDLRFIICDWLAGLKRAQGILGLYI
jgi:hypothetical protein